MFEAIWLRLTWWRWAKCWACGRRVWGAYKDGTLDVLCDRADCPMAPEPPVYATHEDALREVMRTGRAAVFEANDRGEFVKKWEDGAPARDPNGRDR